MTLKCEYPMGKYRYVDLGPDSDWDEVRIKAFMQGGTTWFTDDQGWNFDISKVVGWKLIPGSNK